MAGMLKGRKPTIFLLLIVIFLFSSIASAEYKSDNTYLDVTFGETSSNLWDFMYAPETWGNACRLEHFGVYTEDWNTTRPSDEGDFVLDQSFDESPGGRTATLHCEDLSVTREVYLPPGDALYFNISYTLRNTDPTHALKDVRFFEAVGFDIVGRGESYGRYIGSTDTIWQNNDQYFRIGFGGDRPSTGHGMGSYDFEISSDWADGALNGLDKFPEEGTADVAVGMQWNLGDLEPGHSGQINITFYFGGSAGIYLDAGPNQTASLAHSAIMDGANDTLIRSILPEGATASQEDADSAATNPSVAMLGQADLAVTFDDLRINPHSPAQGDNVTIEATVRNLGSKEACGAEVQILDNDSLIYSQASYCLSELSAENFSFTWQAPAGVHNIKVVVNPWHEINESSYENNEATESFSVAGQDLSKPTINNLQPPDGSVVSDNMTVISADLADEGSGVNVSSVRISADEVDVTGKSTITAAGVRYTPREALSYGRHTVQVSAEDNYGNERASSWSFNLTDSEPPEISDLQPLNGSTIGEIRPLISASIRDEASGIDPRSLVLIVDGSNVTESMSVFPNKIWYTIQKPLSAGRHSVTLKAEDLQGNAAERTWYFLLEEQRPSAAGHITVCAEGCDYTSIQKAVNSATPGAFIEVREGVYRESVNVTKPLTLQGISLPTVDAGSKSSAIALSSDGIVLQGFRAENASSAGIYVHSNDNLIKNNQVKDNRQYGIYLCTAKNNTAEDNKATRNGFGFYLGCISLNNTLSGNIANGNGYGVFIELKSSGNLQYLNRLYENRDHNAYDNNVDPAAVNRWNSSSVGNHYGDSGCVDSDDNGICDREYAIPGGGSVDWHPLRSPDLGNVSMEKPPRLPEIDKPPEIVRLTPDKGSPQVAGASVTWTAEAVDPENSQILHRFFLSGPSTDNVSKMQTGWTADNAWTWNTSGADVGENRAEVWIRDGMHAAEDSFDDRRSASFVIESLAPVPVAPPNDPPTISSLAADKSSPQVAGTAITWTSKASDPDNDPIQYKFFLDDQPQTDWSYGSSWIWTMTTADIGSHLIEVKIRDRKHNSEGDDSGTAQFAIELPNQPPIVKDLTPDKRTPQAAGTIIIWTARATDPDGDDILYKFILDRDTILRSTNENWNNDPTRRWDTSQLEPGPHSITLEVRDGKHASQDGFDDRMEVRFALTPPTSDGPVSQGGKTSASALGTISSSGLTTPTGPYIGEIKGCLKYVGGNAVRAGVDVRLQEIFEGNAYDIGSAVSSRQDGTFSITYTSDRLHNPNNPYLVVQAFRGRSLFCAPVKIENLEGPESWVEIIC